MQLLHFIFKHKKEIVHLIQKSYQTMAYKASSFLAFILITNILLVTTFQAVAKRNIIPKNSNTNDKKEPQWFFHFDGLPGLGRAGSPPLFGTPQNPPTGGGGAGSEQGGAGAGAGPAGGSYVPGGDDTFVPNPGFEVPSPGGSAGVPAPAQP